MAEIAKLRAAYQQARDRYVADLRSGAVTAGHGGDHVDVQAAAAQLVAAGHASLNIDKCEQAYEAAQQAYAEDASEANHTKREKAATALTYAREVHRRARGRLAPTVAADSVELDGVTWVRAQPNGNGG